MKPDVFISYHHDSSFSMAQSVAIRLETLGLRCWYAPRDVSGSYAGSIVKAIEECSVFLLILNKEASYSPHVLNEIEIAFKRLPEITIVPFHIADKDISKDARYYLSRMHWVDGIAPPFEARLEDLSNNILNTLGKGKTSSDGNKVCDDAPEGFTPEFIEELRGMFQPDSSDKSKEQKENPPEAPVKKSFIGKLFEKSDKKIDTRRFGSGSYEGESRFGLPNGKGKMTWTNGDSYEGDWVNGTCTGKGKFIWASGDVYEGDFVKGVPHGKGRMTWISGDFYEGDWANGKMHGMGALRYANGVVNAGRFENNEFKLF